MTSYEGDWCDEDDDIDKDTAGQKRAADGEGATEPPANKAANGW